MLKVSFKFSIGLIADIIAQQRQLFTFYNSAHRIQLIDNENLHKTSRGSVLNGTCIDELPDKSEMLEKK